MKKRYLFAALLAVLCLVSVLLMPVDAQAATYSGSCGDNVKWSLNTSTGVLTISGTGRMTNYGNNSPWLEYREDIKRVVIRDGVTNIGTTAFSCCENITSVVIPDSVTIIGEHAFYWCSGLTSVEIPDSVITIGDEAFQYCYSLASVTIGDSVTTIGAYAFQSNCLTSVEIPDSVTKIGEGAFYNNDMTTVEISANVTSIGAGAFARCASLTGIWVDSRNAYYCNDEYGVLFNKAKTELIAAPGTISGTYSIPDSVTTIIGHAFDYCTSLAGIVLPERITSIDGWAFNYCIRLTNIVFPESLTSIGTYAFASNDRLKEIVFRGDAPSIGFYAFGKSAFNYVTATAYYPPNNDTWTADVMQNYGGEITWVINCTHEWVDATCAAPKTCSKCGSTEGSALEHTYESVVTAPTCTEQGYTTHTCSVCGDCYKDTYVAEKGHAWGEWYTVDEASCTAEGLEQRDCDVCDSFETNTLPIKDHSYESVVTAPTCTEQGYTTHTCSACGDSYKDSYVAENGHAWGEWYTVDEASCASEGMEQRDCDVCDSFETNTLPMKDHSYESVVTAPTCTEQGYTTYTCSGCADAYVADQVAATGHSYTGTVTLPTCTEAGYTTYTCAACGDEYQDDHVEATGHNYGDWFVENPATCTEKGNERRECQNCDHFETAELAATGHTEVVDAAVEALCTATGLTEGKHCQVCEEILVVQNMTPALGHTDADKDYVCDVCDAELCVEHKEEVIQGKTPTCLYDGLTDGKRCAICGDILKAQEVIPALGHTWEAATCDTAKTCTVCAATEGEALGHHYGDWTQVKVPTTEETGLEERVCTNCGIKEQREVDKLEPAPTEPKPTEPAQTQPVQTAPVGGDAVEQEQGERGNSTLWIAVICALGGVALGAFAVLIVLMKKKEK